MPIEKMITGLNNLIIAQLRIVKCLTKATPFRMSILITLSAALLSLKLASDHCPIDPISQPVPNG